MKIVGCPAVELCSRQVGPWPLNTYALVCPQSRHSVLIDPGDEPEVLSQMLEGTRPQAILVTHAHPDHIGALNTMRRMLDVPVLAHPGVGTGPFEADQWLSHGDLVAVGQHALRVYYTPGHTPDHLSFGIEADHRIIVGDSIFEGGPGRTGCTADFQRTIDTLKQVILAWPDEFTCHPGHGASFGVGSVRPAIERFLAKDHGAFYGDAVWDM